MDEREFELINILGADLGSNQREISRHMNLSLGMINMLIRRVISKGYIRIEQLNKRKVQYILTPMGFAEKMRKSVKYTLKTINSISLIKNKLRDILCDLYQGGVRNFFIYGSHDLNALVEMVIKEIGWEDHSFIALDEIPTTQINGILLIGKEIIDEENLSVHRYVYLLKELAKNANDIQALSGSISFDKMKDFEEDNAQVTAEGGEL